VQVPVTKQAKPRFEVKKWTAVAFWSWDIQIENCAICRNHLMEPCIECQPNAINNNQDPCIAAWGQCNHAFHFHCINRWLKTRHACPLDNTEWVTQKLGTWTTETSSGLGYTSGEWFRILQLCCTNWKVDFSTLVSTNRLEPSLIQNRTGV